MDQTALVMALHGFGNVIDDTGVACGRKFVSINAAEVKSTLRQQATPSFHSTFTKLFSELFTKEPYTANQALPKEERRDLGYYRGPTKGHARMGEKVKEYADEFKEEWNAPALLCSRVAKLITRCETVLEHSLKRRTTSASHTPPASALFSERTSSKRA